MLLSEEAGYFLLLIITVLLFLFVIFNIGLDQNSAAIGPPSAVIVAQA